MAGRRTISKLAGTRPEEMPPGELIEVIEYPWGSVEVYAI